MSGKKTKNKTTRGALRPIFFVSLALALLALLLHLLAARSTAVADALNTRVAPFLRALLAYSTAVFPFSVAEAFLLSSPVLLLLLCLLVRQMAKKREWALRMLSVLLSVPLLVYSLFVFTFATGYYATPLHEQMALSDREPDAVSLYALATHLAASAEEERMSAGIAVGEEGSRMPYSYGTMNQHLIRSYSALSEQYPFLSKLSVGSKPVLLSEQMAYTHITGVYTFLTGEMNVCTTYPDFSTVFTAAHEMAHARGVAREDEANFVAYLACASSEDAYLRYAGYTNLLQYVLGALYNTDRELHGQVLSACSGSLLAEYRAYNVCYRRYESVASEVAGNVNNAYLEGMGTEGTVSYDLVVRLAVKYFDLPRTPAS